MPDIDIPELKKMHHTKLKMWGKDKCHKCEIPFKRKEHLTKVRTSNGTKYYHHSCWVSMLH